MSATLITYDELIDAERALTVSEARELRALNLDQAEPFGISWDTDDDGLPLVACTLVA